MNSIDILSYIENGTSKSLPPPFAKGRHKTVPLSEGGRRRIGYLDTVAEE
jgi:hypothetical protein